MVKSMGTLSGSGIYFIIFFLDLFLPNPGRRSKYKIFDDLEKVGCSPAVISSNSSFRSGIGQSGLWVSIFAQSHSKRNRGGAGLAIVYPLV